MQPSDFNIPDDWPVGLGIGKFEKELFICHALCRHIDEGIPFDQPIQYKLNHDEMVPEWLTKGDTEKSYTLTRKSLDLLWAKYGKK